VLIRNQLKVLAFFAISKKEGGQQTLNRFDICNKSSKIPRKNEFASLAKSFDGFFAKTLYPEKVKLESSFSHFQFDSHRGRHQNIRENSISNPKIRAKIYI